MLKSTEAYGGHSIYEYIFSISGKICAISISGKIFLTSEKIVFWKNRMLNLRKMSFLFLETFCFLEKIFLNSEKNNFVFWKEIFSNYEEIISIYRISLEF